MTGRKRWPHRKENVGKTVVVHVVLLFLTMKKRWPNRKENSGKTVAAVSKKKSMKTKLITVMELWDSLG